MKTIKVPILTEEYKVIVVLGKPKELARYGARHFIDYNYESLIKQIKGTRGTAWNLLPDSHPRILLRTDIEKSQQICSLAHEATHCIDFIINYVSLFDDNGEFMGHGVGAIMRHCVKYII